MVSSSRNQVVQITIGDQPQPEELAANLSLFRRVIELLTVVLSQVLEVAAVYQHHKSNRDAVELEQPKITDNGSTVALEV